MSTPVIPAAAPLGRALLVAALVIVVGGVALRGAGAAGRGDPTASIDNGAPRGLLAARLLLEHDGVAVRAARVLGPLASATASLAGGSAALLVLVPPPEQDGLAPDEVDELLTLAGGGARLVVLCDGERRRTKRLKPLLARVGVDCVIDDDAATVTTALPLVPGLPVGVRLRDRARLALTDEPGLVPLAAVDGVPVVVTRALGRGDVVVLASASSLANDGLADGDGASWLRWLAQGRAVLVDERHHTGRGRALARRALLEGPGPVAALVAAVLLVLGSLLALAPRAGDPPDDDDVLPVPTTKTRVRGLAAVLARARRDGRPAARAPSTHAPPPPSRRGHR
ncbi:MAG: hypothetical protein FJ137_02315 [Deltaproteobacteria bacterium]|nr:hypothetical protein [Deltaproteobacteria bacterium]